MIEVHNLHVTSMGYSDIMEKDHLNSPCYMIYTQEAERIKNIKEPHGLFVVKKR